MAYQAVTIEKDTAPDGSAEKQKEALRITKNRHDPVWSESFPVKLQRFVRQWRIKTAKIRETNKKMLIQYANGYYSGNGAMIQPMNLIDRGVNIIAPYLISKNPKILVDAKQGVPAARSFARTMELAMENLVREIKLSKATLRPAAFNSFFSMGIVRTGVAPAWKVEVMGYLHDVGQPYADNINFEDYIGDFGARCREEMVMEGNSYLLSEEFIKTSGLYKNYDTLQPDNKNYESTHPSTIVDNDSSAYQGGDSESLRPECRLIDLWIPDERIIITIPEEGNGNKIMRTVEYDGPDDGPYDTLTYGYFPNTIIPIPPVYKWSGLNSIINRLCSKMSAQALREKKMLLYELGNSDDAELIENTEDGGRAGVRSVDSMKEVEFGGVAETNFTFMQFLENQYSISGGNLYTIGGRDTQAETLGQEQMLQANASKQLQDMVYEVHEFTKSIITKLAGYLWVDPMKEMDLVKEIGEFKLRTKFTPDIREGKFLDYTFDVEPYSMSALSPEVRYQRLMQLIGQVVLPTVEIAAQQGSMLNVDELVKESARYLDIKNLDKWWKSAAPQSAQPNAYQPLADTSSSGAGQSGKGAADARFGGGKAGASRSANNNQHMSRTAGENSSEAVSSKVK